WSCARRAFRIRRRGVGYRGGIRGVAAYRPAVSTGPTARGFAWWWRAIERVERRAGALVGAVRGLWCCASGCFRRWAVRARSSVRQADTVHTPSPARGPTWSTIRRRVSRRLPVGARSCWIRRRGRRREWFAGVRGCGGSAVSQPGTSTITCAGTWRWMQSRRAWWGRPVAGRWWGWDGSRGEVGVGTARLSTMRRLRGPGCASTAEHHIRLHAQVLQHQPVLRRDDDLAVPGNACEQFPRLGRAIRIEVGERLVHEQRRLDPVHGEEVGGADPNRQGRGVVLAAAQRRRRNGHHAAEGADLCVGERVADFERAEPCAREGEQSLRDEAHESLLVVVTELGVRIFEQRVRGGVGPDGGLDLGALGLQRVHAITDRDGALGARRRLEQCALQFVATRMERAQLRPALLQSPLDLRDLSGRAVGQPDCSGLGLL